MTTASTQPALTTVISRPVLSSSLPAWDPNFVWKFERGCETHSNFRAAGSTCNERRWDGGDEKENYHPPHTVKGEGGHVANLRCTAAELESEIVIAVGVTEVARQSAKL